MKLLNLGSSSPKGQYLDKDWINVDLFKCHRLNVQANIMQLPFRDNTFNLIHCVHVAEHLTRDKTVPLLKEAYRVLAPGGYLFVETPDFQKIVYLLAFAFKEGDSVMAHKWTTSVFGRSERPGMAHFTGFTPVTLTDKAKEAGFNSVTYINAEAEMISNHYLQEPVILLKCQK